MEFHGTRIVPFQITQVAWNSMEYCMHCYGTKTLPTQIYHHVLWISIDPGERHLKLHHSTIAFNGIFHGIPLNYEVAKSNITEFYGIPWKFEIITLIDIRFPWIFHWQFHGILESPIQMSWNSMELGLRNFKLQGIPWNSLEYSMEPCRLQIKCHRLQWISKELGGRHYK